MSDDLRACTHKQLPLPADGLALPRAAAAHADGLSAPKTASQTAADALRAGAAWDCILRMPLLREAWKMPAVGAALLRQRAGRKSGEEDRRLAVNTANVMEWKTFQEFHD